MNIPSKTQQAIQTAFLRMVVLSCLSCLSLPLFAMRLFAQISQAPSLDQPINSHTFCQSLRGYIHQVQSSAFSFEQRIKATKNLPPPMIHALTDSALNALNQYGGKLVQEGPEIDQIKEILGHLSTHISKPLTYEVYFLKNSKITNAFAIPPNVLVISESFFHKLSEESELAFILAHELAHIYLEHSLSLVTVIYELIKKIENEEDKAFILALVSSQLVQRLYGSLLEEQADIWALELLYLDQYSLKKLSKLWVKMDRIQQEFQKKYDYQAFKRDFGEDLNALDQIRPQLLKNGLNVLDQIDPKNKRFHQIKAQIMALVEGMDQLELKEEIKLALATHPDHRLRHCIYLEAKKKLHQKYGNLQGHRIIHKINQKKQ
jgi:Zn-dependent protease with chaperone function